MYSKLSLSTWNINDLKNCMLGKKLSNSDFIKNIEDHDLIFLGIETWSNETNSIPGFKAISTVTATPKSNFCLPFVWWNFTFVQNRT